MKYLLDSNLIIYAGQKNEELLRIWIAKNAPLISMISKVETLGYQKLSDAEKKFLEEFFSVSLILSVSDAVGEQAILLRQKNKISLGDALIAATAIVHNLTLATANTADFKKIKELDIINPRIL